MYECYLDTDEPQAWYIHEAYKDVGSFQSHMQNVRPVLPGAETLFDVEKLNICGPLTTELSSHFASLYGERSPSIHD
jgi:hypothetical protein